MNDRVSPLVRITRGLIHSLTTAILVVMLTGMGGCSGCSISNPFRGWFDRVAPTPKAAKVYFVVVEETSARTPEIARVLNDMAYWQGLRSQGHDWIFYDKDSQTAIQKGYVREAGTSLPVLMALDAATGKVLKKVPLPSTTAGVEDIKREVTGK